MHVADYLSGFIIPAAGIIAVVVGLFGNIAGIVMHLLVGMMNIGYMTFFIMFFKSREGMDLSGKLYQIVVPPISMGLVAIVSFILCIDQCRHAYYSSKKKQESHDTHYAALEGGKLLDSDSDSE